MPREVAKRREFFFVKSRLCDQCHFFNVIIVFPRNKRIGRSVTNRHCQVLIEKTRGIAPIAVPPTTWMLVCRA